MTRTHIILTTLGLLGLSACGSSPTTLKGDTGHQGEGASGGGETVTIDATGVEYSQGSKNQLNVRRLDYNEALRTASLKLVRALPTMTQIKHVATADDKRAAYEEELDAMFADPRFTTRMIKWWRDNMRLGGAGADGKPSRDTAPVFAARVVVEEQPFSELFTAPNNTCPTYDGNAKAFADGECNNGVPAVSGILTDPGAMYQFYGNMAFRRVRWLQEVFVCTKFPAEYAETPVHMGSADYTSPWAFESVAKAPIDFQDTSSVICANCHTTINHIAPLFANFDNMGQYQSSIQVMTPIAPDPVKSEISHWLRDGETMHWRKDQPVKDLVELGQAMAADPDVAECAVARAYNFAFSKEDIVTDLATVPPSVLQAYVDEFQKNGQNLKKTMRAIFASADFVRY